ncbi:hypothetical protein SAMN04487949_1341 [Halogranum gelatinilyticum]|uniref:Uncharacterized protein n=1 Tax=Halogranum gelatinilyticum TaxID=660521 RepID=A0A1G9RGV9_9EURY|nr:hypothetical protein [Halogranum gelatinilyticum]SDM22569.1 hypothetical protein SAMN04487949_1341 [Halogranum gelatinilyticum]
MSLGRIPLLTLAVLVVLAGCSVAPNASDAQSPTVQSTAETPTTAVESTQPTPEPPGGYGEVYADVVADAPENATVVDASTSSVAESQSLRDAVDRAVAADGDRVTVRVEGESAYRSVDERFGRLPLYFGADGTSEPTAYVRHEGVIVRLSVSGGLYE